ncbi:MAG: GntR family transcriptional regulator [Propionicimonas sp.]|uniref:GntR family transcriptional regulator n=1 Tax=Propionicimonas sp. TaxID=1955623 RepID=UPI003D0EFDD9
MPIERRALREQVRDELLSRMRTGAVKPGEGINEVQLAAEIGVSRTPLREALIALETEGQIESESGKGFRFVAMSAREFEELAPVISALEGLAIELSPGPKMQKLGQRLARLAADFDTESAAHSMIMTRDDEWHGVMLSACPNERLLALIATVRLSFHRYESLLVPNEAVVERVAAEHAAIAACLIEGDVPGAQAALKANWVNGAKRILLQASSRYLSA